MNKCLGKRRAQKLFMGAFLTLFCCKKTQPGLYDRAAQQYEIYDMQQAPPEFRHQLQQIIVPEDDELMLIPEQRFVCNPDRDVSDMQRELHGTPLEMSAMYSLAPILKGPVLDPAKQGRWEILEELYRTDDTLEDITVFYYRDTGVPDRDITTYSIEIQDRHDGQIEIYALGERRYGGEATFRSMEALKGGAPLAFAYASTVVFFEDYIQNIHSTFYCSAKISSSTGNTIYRAIVVEYEHDTLRLLRVIVLHQYDTHEIHPKAVKEISFKGNAYGATLDCIQGEFC